MKNTRNKIRVSTKSRFLMLFGFAFFINPVPANVDILPDALGCILLFFGLTQLAYFDGAVENARKALVYLFSIEFIKLLLTKAMLATEIGSNRMLAATSFSIVEGILYIIIFRQLFGGISYFSMRNNLNESLRRCDNLSFLSYLAFFTRVAATLLPELLAIAELKVYTETDFAIVDTINDILSVKPVLVVLLSIVSIVTSAVWFVSLCKFFKIFYIEAGEMLDLRYDSEYTEKPDSVRIRKLRIGKYAIYVSLFFLLDIVFDGVRAIPASVMFLLLFFSCFLFDGIYSFKKTKTFAIPSFLLMLGTEIFRFVFTPNGAIVIYETELWKILVGSLLAIVTAIVSLICIRAFLLEARSLSKSLNGSDISIFASWISFCIVTVLWGIGFAVPYFYPFIVTARYVAVFVFICKTAKIFSIIYEEEEEKFILK